MSSRHKYALLKCSSCGDERMRRTDRQTDLCRRCAHITHGMWGHPLWEVWRAMMARCGHRKGGDHDYTHRGIVVCDEWRSNRAKFFEWALCNGYRPGWEIDRENNDGNYEPSNCRFVSRVSNAQNRSDVVLSPQSVSEARRLATNGVSVAAIGRHLNVSYGTILDAVRGRTWGNVP